MTNAEVPAETVSHHPKDYTGARIGMWLFLFTELLLFGGLFLLYSVYRAKFPADFHFSAGELDTFLGTLNTVILLTSSLTMVLAVAAFERRQKKPALGFMAGTIVLGLVFMVNKYFEWSAKFSHGLYPNSEILESHGPGENVFYSLYYLMTGLHGIHILIGIIILVVMFIWTAGLKAESSQGNVWEDLGIKVENSGLYWHLVVLIWIFLFPLIYLIT